MNRRPTTDDGRRIRHNPRAWKLFLFGFRSSVFGLLFLVLGPPLFPRSPQPGRLVAETGSNVISGTKNFLGATVEVAPATTASNPVPLNQVQSLISTGATSSGSTTNIWKIGGSIGVTGDTLNVVLQTGISGTLTNVAGVPTLTLTNTYNLAALNAGGGIITLSIDAETIDVTEFFAQNGTISTLDVLDSADFNDNPINNVFPGSTAGDAATYGQLITATNANSILDKAYALAQAQSANATNVTSSGVTTQAVNNIVSGTNNTTLAALVTATNANSILDQAYALAQASSNNVLKWFNVRNYGAQGTGTTNDFLAINSAVMAAKAATGTNRHKVYFPNGTYLLDSVTNSFFFIELANATNIDLLGESQYGTVLIVTNRALAALTGSYAPSIIHISQAKGITVENFTMTGMGQETNDVAQLLCGIGFSESWKDVRLKNVLIQDISGHGVLCASTAVTISSGDNLYMENVTVNSSGNFALADGHSFALAVANVTALNCAASNSAMRILEAVWSAFGTNPTRHWLVDGFTGKDAAVPMVEFVGIAAATNVTMQNISIVNSYFEQSRTNVTTALVLLNGYTATDRTLLDVNFSNNHLVNRGGVQIGLSARVAVKNALIANNIVDGFTASGMQNDWSANGPNTNVQFIGNTVIGSPLGYDFYQVTNQVIGYNSASSCGTGVLVYGNSSGVQVQGGDYGRCFAPVVTAAGSSSIINFGGITNNHNSAVNIDAELTANSLVVDAGTIWAKAGITGNGSFTLSGNLVYPRLVITASTNFTALAMVSNTWFFCDTTSGNQSNVLGSSGNNAGNNLGGLGGIKWFSSTNLTGTVILDGGTATFQFTDTGTRYLTLNCPFTVGIQLNKINPNPRASVIGGNVWPQVTAGTVTGAVVRSGDGFTGSTTNAVTYYAGGIVTNAASLPEPTGTANVTHTSTNWVLATWYTNSGTCAQVSVGARQTPTAAAAGVELRVTVKGSSVTNIYAPAYIGALAGADRVAMLAAPIGTNDVFAFIDTGSSASTLTNGMYDLVGCGAVGPAGATGPAGSEVLPTTLLSGQTVSQTISLGRSAMYAFTNALTTNQVWSFTSATNGADVSVDVTYASTTTNTIKLVPASGMTLNLYSATNSLSVSNLPAFFSLDVGQTNRVSFGGGVTVQ